MGRMTLGDYARGGRGHLGSLGGRKSRKLYAAQLAAQHAHDAAVPKVRTAQGAIEANLGKIERAASAARDQSFMIQDMASQIDHPSALSMQQQAQDAAMDIETIYDEARGAYETFESEFATARAAGGHWAPPMIARAEAMNQALKAAAGRIGRAGSVLAAAVGRLKTLQKRAAEAAAGASAAEADRIRLEDERRQRELDLRAADEQRAEQLAADRRAREEQARQSELEFQRMQVEEQRRLADEERALEAEERGRIAQIEQSRIDAEMRREQMAIDAEERRRRMEQEAILRTEEREIRREEREAQLQQLMMIQELAAQGLPAGMLPPGLAPPMPQAPAGMAPRPGGQFIQPGFAPPPGAIPQQMWSPYGPMVAGPGGTAPMGFAPQVPGVAQMPGGLPPGYPGMAPPGYAATPPQPVMTAPPAYAQSPGFPAAPSPYPQQPAGAAPPGFAWGGFDPGAEMFGLGELHETFNPNLQGALIEEGWTMEGPENDGKYSLYRPTGQLFRRLTEDQVYAGTIRDERGSIVWTSPPARPQGSGAAVGAEIAATIREAIKATGGVLSERERRKGAKDAASGMPMSIPGGGFDTEGRTPGRTSNVALVAVGLVAAAAAFWGIPKLINRKRKA